MMRRLTLALLAPALALLAPAPARAEVTLVRDGRAVAEIVVSPDALQVVKLAADDLQRHLALMSGATLPIVTEPTPGVENRVYVGTSRFTAALGFEPARFRASGFEIFARDNRVILAGADVQREPSRFAGPDGQAAWQEFTGHGFSNWPLPGGTFNPGLGIDVNDDTGTWYAVAELLEQLGVRWYMPYEDGTVIPDRKTVVIDQQHLVRETPFDRREWCYYGPRREDAEGIAWFKRLKAGNHNRILFGHTTYAIYSSAEQQSRHPEYLARDADGQPYAGYPAGRGMPRYTDPGFRDACAVWLDKVFEAFPDLVAVSLGPPDGGVRMDARDVERFGAPGDSLEQRTSNHVWDFNAHMARELKKTNPDKFLVYESGAGAGGYSGAGRMPTNIEDFPDNLLPCFGFYNSSQLVLDTSRRQLFDQWEGWRSRIPAPRRGPAWNYFLWYRTPDRPRYPVIFSRSLQREIREIIPHCDGTFIEIQPELVTGADGRRRWRLNTPGLIHLMVYLKNKLFWQPDLDLAALLDEYYELFFGPAAGPMRDFYEYAEAVWSRQESRSVTPATGFLKEADVDRFFERLAAARRVAGEGTVHDRRIALIESEMQPLRMFFPNLARTGPDIRAYPAPGPVALDGDPGKYRHGWFTLRDNLTGETPAKNETRAVIALAPDRSAMYVAVVCYENRMGGLKADTTLNDDFGIFEDDVVEVYVNTPQRSYFKVVVNPNGATWDESTDVAIIERDTLPVLWNPGVQAVVVRHGDRWTVEIMIPTRDFGNMGPSETFPWGIQVGRTRFTGSDYEVWAAAPTGGGPYATLNRWGNLRMR